MNLSKVFCIKLFLIFLLFTLNGFSQERKLRKAIRLLSSSEYADSKGKILDFMREDPTSPLGYFCLHLWFLESQNPSFNPDSSYFNLLIAINHQNYLQEKDVKEACEDFGFCESNLSSYKEKTAYQALLLIKRNGNLSAINSYLSLYNGLSTVKYAIEYRDSIKLQAAIIVNNSEALKLYILEHPNSKFLLEAKQKLVQVSFDEAKLKNTEKSYIDFQKEFPGSVFDEEALKLATQISFLEARRLNTEDGYQKHISNYPRSVFLDTCKSAATFLGFNFAKKLNSETSYVNFLSKYPGSAFTDSANYFLCEAAFREAETLNTEASFENFILKYPNCARVSEAKQKQEDRAFVLAKESFNEPMLERFMSKYPNSLQLENARNLKESAAFFNAKKINREEEFLNFINKYPNSSRKDSCKILAEKSAFESANGRSDVEELKKFLANYPNGVFHVEAEALLNELENKKALTMFRESNIESLGSKEIFSTYMKDPVLNYFFKADTAMLQDQIRGFKIKGFNSADYFNSNYLCEEDYSSDSEKKVSFDGLYIYDKTKSVFCCNCPSYSYNENKTSTDGTSCLLIDDKGKAFNPVPLKGIKTTPLSYILLVQDMKGKYNLFNTRTRKFISGWYKYISFVFLNKEYFRNGTMSHSLLEQNHLFIGFKCSLDNVKTQRYILINSKAQEMVDGLKYRDFFNGPYDLIKVKNCESGREYPSDFIRFSGNPGEYGVTTVTMEKEILPPVYNRIDDMDFYQNLILSKYGADRKNHATIYNLRTKKFMSFSNNPSRIERVFVPYYRDVYSDFNVNIMGNQMYGLIHNENNPCYDVDYDDNSELSDKKSNQIVYIAEGDYSDKSNKAWALYNHFGKLLVSGKSRTELLMATDSIIHVRFEDNQDVIINYNGDYIWNPNKKQKAYFVTPDIFFYGYKTEQENYLGLYSIKSGKICDPIYENLIFEEDAVYGIKLGKRTLLYKGKLTSY